MTSLTPQSWSPFRQPNSSEPQYPMISQSPYQHLNRPVLSRNSSTGSENGASLLQQQHRQNQFAAAFQGGHSTPEQHQQEQQQQQHQQHHQYQLRQSSYATRAENYQHNLALAAAAQLGDEMNQEEEEEEEEKPPIVDFTQTVYDPFRIKHRRRTSAPQLRILEHFFLHNPKPDIPLRKILSEQLDMSAREVQVWFQNRRAKTKKLREKGELEEGEEEGSPEFSGPLPSPPIPQFDPSTSSESQETSPVDTPGFEPRNVYEVTGYPNQQSTNTSSQQGTRTAFFPNSSAPSFTPYSASYSNPNSHFTTLSSSNEARGAGDHYPIPQGRPIRPEDFHNNRTYSPSTLVSPWPTSKEADKATMNRYQHSLSINQEGGQDVQGVLADYELTGGVGRGIQRPPGEYGYGVARDEVEGFSPDSSNDEPSNHHDYSSISSTNSRLYEPSRSLPSYSFGSELSQRGSPQTYENNNEQHSIHPSQQSTDSSTNQRQQHSIGPYVRRASCPTGLVPTFDTLGFNPNAPATTPPLWPSAPYVTTPTQLTRTPNAAFGSAAGSFFPLQPAPTCNHNSNSSCSTPNPYLHTSNNPLNNLVVQSSSSPGNNIGFNYSSTPPPTASGGQRSTHTSTTTSGLGTIVETNSSAANTTPTKFEKGEHHLSTETGTTEAVLDQQGEQQGGEGEIGNQQSNSSAGTADRSYPQLARKARSQLNLRNPYPQEKKSPGSQEKRALATEI